MSNRENQSVCCEIPFKPLERIKERIELGKSDSNAAYFDALMYGCEFICKMTACLLVASITNDQDKSRYRFEYLLVRADGLGDWFDSIQKLLTGPSSTLMDAGVKGVHLELTSKATNGDWQFAACEALYDALSLVSEHQDSFPKKTQLLRWFSDFARLRNKTRGHGAVSLTKTDHLCCLLERSFSLMESNLSIFKFPMAYVRRNISGKYRVSLIGGERTPFEYLKKSKDVSLEDGVYVAFEELRQCSLMVSDADLQDFYLPNGGFSDKHFEMLSYQSGNTIQQPSLPYLRPVDKLLGSITEGAPDLDIIGNVYSNIPSAPIDYIERRELENVLTAQLSAKDRHPIVTMDGRGGIGKTSTALHVVRNLIEKKECPYSMVIWFSARDVDLLPEGIKEVRPAGVTIDDFAKSFVDWVSQLKLCKTDFKDNKEVLANALANGSEDREPILFVFDNFETVVSPEEAYKWIDSFVRSPNKVLITTRVRGRFKADFPVNVRGMADDESRRLIELASSRLGIRNRLSDELIDSVVEESSGHPYVIRIMMGEIAKSNNVKKVERVIAARDDVLDALFERTYRKLAPAAQRIFLTLSGWKSLVPELAVEAVMIRPESEIRDVQSAIDELVDYSFVERMENGEGETFLSVPLVAQVFGKKKITTSPHRGGIRSDLDLLLQFGAIARSSIDVSFRDRLRVLFANIDKHLSSGENKIEDFRSVIEYVARTYPQAWRYLADVYRDSDNRMAEYLEKYVESDGVDDINAWCCLRDLYAKMNRPCDMLNTLSKVVVSPSASLYEISDAINRANSIISRNKELIERADRRQILKEMAESIERHIKECSANDLSRLAWLYLNIGDSKKARETAELGIKKDAFNYHCANILEKMGSS